MASSSKPVAEGARESIPARWVVLPLLVVVLLAIAHEWQRGRARLTASRALSGLESSVARSLATGGAAEAQLQAGVQLLRKLDEEKLDPSEVGIPMALGSHYLLLESPDAAIRWYETALALETRPEILINLARAHRMAGNEEQALLYLEQAQVLDPLRYSASATDDGRTRRRKKRSGR